MIKNLKNLVIFLGIIVLLLFSITIVSLIYKFKNRDIKNIENLTLSPKLSNETLISAFEIKDNKLYLKIKENKGAQIIKIYNINNGMHIGTIRLTE